MRAPSTRPQDLPVHDLLEQEDEGEKLVLYNDDINTFDHVIRCLIRYCDHEPEQAEQCAWIVHLKGRCTVKLGTYPELLPIHSALCDQGLSAAIEG
ncbi:MAG: ATP-dependent Clp protease adaptor ClpS [Bacteroidota bacterium]|jgi:ATP-dependent Clp protease adaptor protein ClpS